MIKEIFTDNILTKFMAFVMAIALWLYATNRHTGDLTETVRLNISVPDGITVLEQSTEQIMIHLRGPQNIIENLGSMIKEQKIQATYVIRDSPDKIGDQERQTILISREHLNLPGDVKLVSLYPDRVNIVLGKLQKKRVRVNLQKKGEPATGYSIANEFIFPGEVEITGPLKVLRDVDSVNTVPIDIDGITTEQNRTFPWRIGIEQKVTVTQNEKSISVPIQSDEDVRVWLQITEQHDIRLFERVKIKILRPADYPYEIKLQDEFASVKVRGPKLALDRLTPEDILLYIDVTLLKPPGPYKQPLKAVLPKNIEVFDKLSEVRLDIRE
ncbi:MAG: CdaR family protein [Candidatus Loosdrechtia sp.]|uniref:CdaR family protein n=1 Tax=Candidatus Loosdrechtia sp. TaxID=3101272 RepID=UPI003A6FCA82|nr:MAG: CdaR family protein [Candidatus Jettenia sp. AMX2]